MLRMTLNLLFMKKITNEIQEHLSKKQKEALILLREQLTKKKFTDKTLFEAFYSICKRYWPKKTQNSLKVLT